MKEERRLNLKKQIRYSRILVKNHEQKGNKNQELTKNWKSFYSPKNRKKREIPIYLYSQDDIKNKRIFPLQAENEMKTIKKNEFFIQPQSTFQRYTGGPPKFSKSEVL